MTTTSPILSSSVPNPVQISPLMSNNSSNSTPASPSSSTSSSTSSSLRSSRSGISIGSAGAVGDHSNSNSRGSNNGNGSNNKLSHSLPVNPLKSSISGISTDISKLSLYTKDNTSQVFTCDVDREREITEAEQLFLTLPELSYNVTKINQWGKHQKRILKLTNRGIANVRCNDMVSSLYSYTDVNAIYLRDSEVFVLEYKGAAHSYVYKSSIGYQIAQEINNRLALRRSTDKKRNGFDIALEYQKRLLAHTPSIPVGVGCHMSSASSTTSTPTLSDPTSVPSNNSISRSLSFDSSDSSSISSSSSSPPANIIDLVDIDDGPATAGRHQQKRATKLSQLLGTTEEQRLQGEIDRIALNPQSQERKAIQQFVNNFPVLAKNNPSNCITQLRQFIDNTRQSILCDKNSQLSKLLVESNNIRDEDISLTTLVEKNLEKTIILRLYRHIYTVLTAQVAKEESTLQENIAKLASKPQDFFGIKDEYITASNWKSAILELNGLDRCEIPYHKLDCILASARSIYNYINYERKLNNITQDMFLSADDFLPIYIYIVVNSGVKDLEFINQYLWQLCDPDRLGGEGGYYLTVFSSTLSLLKSLNMENIDKATIIDDLILPIKSLSSSSSTSSSSPSTPDSPPSSPSLSIPTSPLSSSTSSWNSASISRRERALSLSLGADKKF